MSDSCVLADLSTHCRGREHLLDHSFGSPPSRLEARPRRRCLWHLLFIDTARDIFIWQNPRRKRGESQDHLKKKNSNLFFTSLFDKTKTRWMNRQKTLAPSSAIAVTKMWLDEKNSSVLKRIQTQGVLVCRKNTIMIHLPLLSPVSCLLSSLSPFLAFFFFLKTNILYNRMDRLPWQSSC